MKAISDILEDYLDSQAELLEQVGILENELLDLFKIKGELETKICLKEIKRTVIRRGQYILQKSNETFQINEQNIQKLNYLLDNNIEPEQHIKAIQEISSLFPLDIRKDKKNEKAFLEKVIINIENKHLQTLQKDVKEINDIISNKIEKLLEELDKLKEVSEKITELEKLSEKRALYNRLKSKIGKLKGFLEQLKKLFKNPSKKDNHEK